MQRGGRSGVRLPTGSRVFFSTPERPDPVSGSRILPLKGYRSAVFPQGNRTGREGDHPLTSSARLRMSRVVPLLLVYFHAMDWENFFRLTASTDLQNI